MTETALIELVGEDDRIQISGVGIREAEGVKLAEDPEEIFDTGFERSTIPKTIGGRMGRTDIPPRRMTIPLNLSSQGPAGGVLDHGGIEQVMARVRRLFGSALNPRLVQWVYTPATGGRPHWLWIYLDRQIRFSPSRDPNLDGYVKAVISAVALEPRYESQPYVGRTPAHPGGTATYWLPAWNPTDNPCWMQWDLKPNGPTSFALPDFSFGQEQTIDAAWAPGSHAARMVNLPPIDKMWRVRSVRSGSRPYLAADGSNAAGQMGGLFTLYPMPPHTARQGDPVLLPVTVDGPAGAEVKLTMRRFWSAENGF